MPLVIVNSRREDGGPVLGADEEVRLVVPQVVLHLSPAVLEGVGNVPGTLYITTRNVIWLSSTDVAKGVCVDFHFVTVHAIARENESFPSACIYMQLETEEDASAVSEMRLAPSTAAVSLDQIFQVMSECAALNPDPLPEGDLGDSDDEYGGIIWTGDAADDPRLQVPQPGQLVYGSNGRKKSKIGREGEDNSSADNNSSNENDKKT